MWWFQTLRTPHVFSAPLINTHFQVGVGTDKRYPNRFSGFSVVVG